MRKNSNVLVSVERAILEVIRSLPRYEAGYVSLLRRPGSMDKERINTFQQYIECRLNHDFFYVPELRGVIEDFDGYLLRVTSVQQPNTKYKNRFSEIRVEVNLSCPEFIGEDMEEDLNIVKNVLGGTRLIIVSAPRIPKIIVE